MSEPAGRSRNRLSRDEVINEHIYRLKKRRSALIGNLTKLINRVSVAVTQSNQNETVKVLMAKIEQTFDEITQTTKKFEEFVGSEEITRADELVAEQQIKVDQIKEICNEYLLENHSSEKGDEVSVLVEERFTSSQKSCKASSTSSGRSSRSNRSRSSSSHSSSSSRRSQSSLSLLLKRQANSAKADLIANQTKAQTERELKLLEMETQIEKQKLEMETQIEKQKLLEKAEKAKENAEIARLQASWQEKQLNADVSYFAPTIENLRPLNRQKETSIVTGISRKDSEIVPSSLYNDVTYNVQASGETPSLITTLKSEILYDEIPKLHSNFVETTKISKIKTGRKSAWERQYKFYCCAG